MPKSEKKRMLKKMVAVVNIQRSYWLPGWLKSTRENMGGKKQKKEKKNTLLARRKLPQLDICVLFKCIKNVFKTSRVNTLVGIIAVGLGVPCVNAH